MLGPDAGHQVRAEWRLEGPPASPRGSSTSANGSFAVPPEISTGMKFIAGEPMKPGDEQVDGLVVELLRAADLLQLALAHHRDAVAERHRLGLVVGDVDGRRLEPVLDPRDLGPHLHAQLRVEVGERLVHQERARLADDRPAHRDPLALAAGEVRRLAVEVLGRGRGSSPPCSTFSSISASSTFAIFSGKAMFSRTVMCG